MILEKTTGLKEGYTTRPAQETDVLSIIQLLNECDEQITGEREHTKERLLRLWQTPEYNRDASSRVIVSPHGQIVAYGSLWDSETTPVYPWFWGRVHPAYEQQGLGTYLMTWAEERAKNVFKRVPENARVALQSGIIHAHKPSQHLMEKCGLAYIRSFWRMMIAFDEPPAPAIRPDELTLSTYQDRPNIRAVYRALDEAFHDHWGHVDEPEDIGVERFYQYHIKSNKNFDPSLWFLLMDGEEIAGFALCSPKRGADDDLGWINALGVRRPWRRRGLATTLLQHAFHELHQRGKKQAGLGVDASSLTGATDLYIKAGMHVARQFDTYEKELRPGLDLSTQTLQQ